MKGLDPKKIAREFNLEIIGPADLPIQSVASIKNQNSNSLLWAKTSDVVADVQSGYLLVNKSFLPLDRNSAVTFLVTESRQRMIFAKIAEKYFPPKQDINKNYVKIHRQNPNILISENVFIADNVKIGDGTIIHPNVVIHSNSVIGINCIIRCNVSIGTEGLGLEKDDISDELIKFPQVGGVIIHDNVEIGPLSTIRRAALDDTVIGSGTKIGSLVNIGHNCVVGRNCILTSNVILSGSSVIGDDVFFGVSSSVKNGVKIENKAVVGQGAVVTKNIPEGKVFVGNPADDMEKFQLRRTVK